MPPRFMASVKESTLGKEKIRGTASNSSNTNGNGQRRASQTLGSTGKQVQNNLKPATKSLSNDNNIAMKNVKKAAGPEDSQRTNLLRRKSFDQRPPSSATGVQKPLISPGPGQAKPTKSLSVSASFSPRSTTAVPKSTLERVPKKPNIAAKPNTLSSSRSRNYKSTISSTKKGIRISTTSPPSKKIPTISSSHDKKETKHHQTEENLVHDHQVLEEVVMKDKMVDEIIDDFEIPKAEKIVHPDVINTSTDQYHDEVKIVEEVEDTTPPAAAAAGDGDVIISTVLQEHNHHVPTARSTEDIVEDKFHEEKIPHHTKHDDEDKENDVVVSKEEIVNVGHQEIIIPNYVEAGKPETDQDEAEDIINASDHEVGGATKEIEEEKQIESKEENGEGSQVVVGVIDQSRKEEIVEEAKAEAEINIAVVNKTQLVQAAASAVHKKKETPTPYNDVIEETASRLREERKNKVRALVGAFETVIDKEASNAK